MAISPIAIKLSASGGTAVANNFNKVAAAAKSFQTTLQAMPADSSRATIIIVQNATRAARATNQLTDAQRKWNAEQRQAASSGNASRWNAQISAAQRMKAALRATTDEEKKLDVQTRQLPVAFRAATSAGRDLWRSIRSGAGASGQQVDGLIAKMRKLDSAVAKVEFNNVQEKAAGVRNAGLVMGGLGIGGGVLAFKAAQNAGSIEQVKMGFRTSLNGDDKAAESLYGDVKKFDAKSPFGFLDSAKAAQDMLSMGFNKSEIPRIMDALGNAVAAKGGGTEQFAHAARALGQSKALGKFEMDEAHQLIEGGGVPIIEIFKQKFGQERTSKWMSGDEKISTDEGMPAILEWIEKNRGSGMQNALQTLPGQISELQSQFFYLTATVGDDLMPVVKGGTSLLKGFIAILNAMPAPVRKILVGSAALLILFLTLGGGLLVLAGMGASAVISIMGVAQMFGLTGAAAGTASIGISGVTSAFGGLASTLMAVLLPAIAAIAIGAVAAAATVAAIVWTKEASTKSDEEMEGPNSSFRQRTVSQAGRGLASLFGRAETEKGDEAERQSLAIVAKMRRKSPYQAGAKTAPAALAAPSAAATTQAVNAAAATGTPLPGALSGVTMMGSVESLQERLMLSEDKGEKKQLRRSLFYARVRDRHERAAAREDKARERANTRDQKAQDRDRKRFDKEQQQLEDRRNDRAAAIEIAHIEAQTDGEIAALQAQKGRGKRFSGHNAGIDSQIARIKARRIGEVAGIRARYDDEFAEGGGLEVAGLKAGAMQRRADLMGGGAGSAPGLLMSQLRAGGSIFDIPRAGGGIDFGGGQSTLGGGGSGVSRETGGTRKVTLRPQVRASQMPNHRTLVEILPETFEIDNALERSAEAL